jgi:radical SAM superfamily enzyme YgiQ (UPF0313 family)
MRVLLVRPVGLVTMVDLVGPDLGLGLLAAKAKGAGWEARIVDCHAFGLTQEELVEEARRLAPDLIGFKVFTNEVRSINESVQRLRAALPGALVIAGGPLPSAVGLLAAPWLPGVDFFMKGEADESFPRFLRALEEARRGGRWVLDGAKLARIPGLAWRNEDGGWVQNPQDFPADLDAIGLPDWSDYDLQSLPNWSIRCPAPYIPIQTGRGCPYGCRFCSARNINGRRTRRKSAKTVLGELRHWRERHGLTHFSLIDDNLLGDRPGMGELFRRLRDERLGIRWECSTNAVRLTQLDPDLVLLMEQAGCYNMALGIESGNDRMLELLAKSITVGQIRRQVEMVRAVSAVRMHGFFMMGLPGETEAEIRQTIAFADSLPIHTANFFLFTPHPGTPFFDELVSTGRLDPTLPPEESLYERGSDEASPVSRERRHRLLRYAYARFFATPWRALHLAGLLNSGASLRKARDVGGFLLTGRGWRADRRRIRRGTSS